MRTLTAVSATAGPLIQPLSWLRSTRADPKRYRELAKTALLRDDLADDDRAILLGVIARAQLDFSEIREADALAEEALALLSPGAPGVVHAELAALRSNALTLSGQLDDALAVLDAAAATAGAVESGLLDVQRSAVLYRRGEMTRALESADAAVSRIGPDHPIERARALNNRAVIRLYLGNLAVGRDEFDEAERLYRTVGMRIAAAQVLHNRGMLDARLGDLPTALDTFDRAEQELTECGCPIDAQLIARAEIMVMAGLDDDVVELLPDVIVRLSALGNEADAAEGRIYLAQAMLELRDPATMTYASTAAASFRDAGRTGWGVILEDLALESLVLERGPDALPLTEAMTVAAELDRAGMRVFAAASWLRVGIAALGQGRDDLGVDVLTQVAERHDTAFERIIAYEARVRLDRHRGRHDLARRSIAAGLLRIAALREVMDATDLRVHASGWGDRLARLGVDDAWERGSPSAVLLAGERWRASALSTRRVRGPVGTEQQTLLTEFRSAHGALNAALLDGSYGPVHEQRYQDAQNAVSTWARRRSAPAGHGPDRLRFGALRDGLGDSSLVSLVEHDGALAATVMRRGRTRLVDLGPTERAVASARAARTALGRLARLGESPATALVSASASAQLKRFADQVVAPVVGLLHGADDVVVVPVPSLHAAPWSWLLADVATVAIAPSARHWLDAAAATTVASRALVVVGPGLPGAAAEADRIAGLYEDVELLVGDRATLAGLAAGLNGCGVAHLATHATIRTRSPLFSSLRMVDGPATAYDLEALENAPGIVVLSACSSAVAAERGDGELLGLSTVLVAAGTAALVAANVPLPDAASVEVMVALHQSLARGVPVGEAVRAMILSQDVASPTGLVAACSLICVGRADAHLTTVSDRARTMVSA